MIEILVSIAAKVSEYVVGPVVRRLGYVYNYRDNIQNLSEKVEELKDIKNRHQLSVVADEQNGREIHDDVSKWLTSADGFIQETGDDRSNTSCFKGFCPNLKSRYLLGREAAKKTQVADRLIEGGSKFGSSAFPISRLPPLQLHHPITSSSSAVVALAPIPSGAGLKSRTSLLNAIMKALAGEGSSSVNKIGIWGLGGVGKTTLVNQVAQQAAEKKLFDRVLIASVLSTPDYNKIQQQLAEQLGMQFVELTEQARAARLHRRIVNEEKNILIILDDLWEGVELQKIGVPSPKDYQHHHHLKAESYKLVFTSRDRDVLSNQMGTEKDFEIKPLEDEEANILFKTSAVGDSIKDPEFESLATEITHECGGLPIAIVTVATALKNKRLYIWKDALRQLKTKARIPTTIPGMETKVYQSLRLSYDYLESDEIKSFFLLCSLDLTDHIHTTDLLKYGMGLRLFKEIHTFEDARNRVDTLVDKLKASNLLLGSDYNSAVVRMHDLIQDVALEIASTQHHLLTLQSAGGTVLEEWPKMDELRMLTMRDLDVSEFPEELVCPNLRLLGWYGLNPDSVVKIPDTFFNEMKGLNVLDFSRMCLPSLPSSLECLTNLRTLCLDGCELGGDIYLIAELKALEILSLMDSDIEMLPREITRVTRLRLLDLKGSSKLQVIPADVIASLTRLESLRMENSFTQWEMEGGRNACIAELQRLPNLTDLVVQLPDVQLLPKDIDFFDRLERYRIFIGDSWSWRGKFETKKTLKLNDYDIDLHMVDAGINKLLKRSEDLHLSRLNIGGGGANYALSELDGEGFPKLKHLTVESSEGIRYVMNSLELSHSAFPVLEELVLSELSNLEQVCHGQFPAGSFGCLKKIVVERCRSLKFLFSSTLARGAISVVEEVGVSGCESVDNDDAPWSLFPKLQCLTLTDLPELVDIICFRGGQNSSSTRLPQADLDSASTVLFDQTVTFPSLEELSIAGLNHVKRIWVGIQVPHHHHSFSNLKSVRVLWCKELSNVFPPCMLKWLQRLQNLDVAFCGSLEEVFGTEGGGANTVNEQVASTITPLSRLLCLSLPKVKHIWNEDLTRILSFQNLKSVTVLNCGSLKSLFPATLAVRDLGQLKHLHAENCGIAEVVAEANRYTSTTMETSPMTFALAKLTSLTLSRLYQLKNFYAGPHIWRWPSLKELEVRDCHRVIGIFAVATTAQDDAGSTAPFSRSDAFPCLETFTLSFNDHITELWQERFPVDFPKLKDLTVEWCPRISVVIPLLMLRRLRNLEKLRVTRCSSVKEIFQLEGALVKNQAPRLGCLREICLNDLPELMHIWKGNDCEEPTTILKLKSLENLEISACERLKLLFPRAASFGNLQSLQVVSCGSLGSLMSASVAKTLVKLETLIICESREMEQVIDNDGGEVTADGNEIIVFPKLKEMDLRVLPNLTGFNSGGYNFSFPSLDRMKVEECPEMKIFSSGNVAAPMLRSIQVTDDESHWKDDINITIHDLFAKSHA